MKSNPVSRVPLFILFLILLGLAAGPTARADTTVGGTISNDTTWTLAGSPYIVTSSITVKGTDGADGITTLTIEPGVVVKFNTYINMDIGGSSGDPGALSAVGTASSPITLTSNKATPAPGDWSNIRFYNTSDDATTVMEHCVVEYGGYSGGALYPYQASPTFRNVTVRNSKTYGINAYTAAPTIENCTFSGNQNYDLYYTGTVGGSVTGTTINSGIYLLATGTVGFSGNTIHQNNAFPIKAYADSIGTISANTFTNVDAASFIEVSAGTISHDATWTADIPYVVKGAVTVKGIDGADGITTLTIDPGATLKFNTYTNMDIGGSSGDPGALSAVGTASSPITFTSNKATPAPGDWSNIRFYNTSDDATTVMEYCVVEYGGYSGGALYPYQASPTFRNVTVRNSKTYGINAYTAEPTIENCIFSGNQNYDLYYTGTVGGSVTGTTINSGIYLLATGTVNFSGNTIHQNNALPIKAYADSIGTISASTFTNVDAASFIEVSSGTISHDATWTADIPYVVKGAVTVKGIDGADGITTLTIDPGATLKFNTYTNMDIGGSSGDPGALSAVGTASSPITFTSIKATPAPGDWSNIQFYNTSDDAATVMAHCVVEYGGYSGGAIYLYDSSPRIQNTTIRNSKTAGIYGKGVGTGSAEINCNTFYGNQNGIYWTASPAPEIHSNNFSGNTANGLYYSGAQILNAEDNWWGDISGPNAGGDSTYGNVDAEPWSSAEHQCAGGTQNYPPNQPSGPAPDDNSVHVDADPDVTLSWACSDPNSGDTLIYDLYWGTSAESLALFAQGVSEATYSMTGLSAGVTYFWQIIARDSGGLETAGPIWTFTSEGDPPDLIVSSVTTAPTGGLAPNTWITLTAHVTNNSNGPVVDGFVTEFIIDGSTISTKATEPVLAAGSSVQVSENWFYTGGDHAISVVTDSAGAVSESDEGNNNINVLLSTLADITAPSVISSMPSSGASLQQINQISFTLNDSQSSVDDAAVIASFTLTNAAQQTISGTINEDSDTFTFIPNSLPLTDDTYQVSFTAVDTYGNSQVITFDFTLDTVPPAKPTITGGTVASGTIQSRPAENTAERIIAVLEGTRDQGTTLWINGAQYTGEGPVTWSTQISLVTGDNALEVYCLDAAGNQSPSEWVDIFLNAQGGIVYQYDSSGRMIRVLNN